MQDDARYGWGKRPYSWEFSVSAQHEIGRGVSVNGGVFRRWFGNFLVTDDTSHTATDYTPFGIPAVGDSRAAGVGGRSRRCRRRSNTTGFYNVNDARPATNLPGPVRHDVPRAATCIDHWFGFDLGINARLPHGDHRPGWPEHRSSDDGLLRRRGSGEGGQQGAGRDAGRRRPAVNNSINTCHMEQNWLPQVKFLGSYTVPKIDVQIGASYQSIPGIEYAANLRRVEHGGHSARARPPADRRRRDRHDDAGDCSSRLELLHAVQPARPAPRQDYPVWRTRGRTSASTSSTSFNSDVISGLSATYSTWLAPTTVVAPRLLKVSWTFDF